MKFIKYFSIILLFLTQSYVASLSFNNSIDNESLQISTQDSIRNQDFKTSSGDTRTYKDFQDSIYNRLLNLNISARTLFKLNLSLTEEIWTRILNSSSELPYQSALRSLNAVPSQAFIPSGVEKMQYQSNLAAARHIPYVVMPNYGLSVDLNDIGVFLGLIEDTSPEIFYSLDSPNDVEVVIYSIQAKVIATLFSGRQIPGKYKLTWNFRDDNGKRMTSGDYIAEVRIGNTKFVRKRIVIP